MNSVLFGYNEKNTFDVFFDSLATTPLQSNEQVDILEGGKRKICMSEIGNLNTCHKFYMTTKERV